MPGCGKGGEQVSGCGKVGEQVPGCGKSGEQVPGCGKGREQVPGCDKFDTAATDSGAGDPVPALRGKRAFACFSKDDATREKSSSGGIFSELAAKTLEDGGVVFGAAFDGEFNVKLKCVENILDLDDLRRSKYVQSEIGSTFREARSS